MSTSELTTILSNLSLDEQCKGVDSNNREAIIAQLQIDKDCLLAQICAEQWHNEDVDRKQEATLSPKLKDIHALYVPQLPPDNDLSGVDTDTAQLIKSTIQLEKDWQQANVLAEEWYLEDVMGNMNSASELSANGDTPDSDDLSSKQKGKAPETAHSPNHKVKLNQHRLYIGNLIARSKTTYTELG
jgi:hypothetical protein